MKETTENTDLLHTHTHTHTGDFLKENINSIDVEVLQEILMEE